MSYIFAPPLSSGKTLAPSDAGFVIFMRLLSLAQKRGLRLSPQRRVLARRRSLRPLTAYPLLAPGQPGCRQPL